MVKDLYERRISSIRISVTSRCNQNCFYCHKEGEKKNTSIEMTAKEIKKIVDVVTSFGISKVKLTGGEPLLRSDIIEIVGEIKKSSSIKEVSLTTNGILLKGLAASLKEAGLTRINVSLDTLDPKEYNLVTGGKSPKEILSGIREASKSGLYPIKVNMVVLKNINDDEIWEMIEFTKNNGLILQLIELEAEDVNDVYNKYHVNLRKIEEKLKNKSKNTFIREMHHRRRYLLSDGAKIEVVRPMCNEEFCKNCTRIRITSDGKFKPCLFRNDNLVDFITPLRQGASIQELKMLFLRAILRRKPFFDMVDKKIMAE